MAREERVSITLFLATSCYKNNNKQTNKAKGNELNERRSRWDSAIGESPRGALSPTLHVFHSSFLTCYPGSSYSPMPASPAAGQHAQRLLLLLPNWGNRFESPCALSISPWGVYLSMKSLWWSRPFLFFIYYVSKHKNYALKSTFPECKQPVFSLQTQVQSWWWSASH